MSNPDLIMCDELSLGLAPVIVREIYAALPSIVAGGMSAIVVEQDVQLARKRVDALLLLPGRTHIARGRIG